MRNNKGITLVSLISSILLILILAATTIVTSMNAYNQMQFEGAKAELEEMQKLVDEIASDYQVYLKQVEVGSTAANYSDYFNTRYNVTVESEKFANKILSAHTGQIKSLLSFSEIDTASKETDYTKATGFYFTSDDLVKYFGLKGIEPIAVDFLTRTVYSVDGIKDSNDKNTVYYTPSQWGAKKVATATAATSPTIESMAKATSKDDTYEINITFSAILKTSIAEVYFAEESSTNYVKADVFRDVTASNGTKTIIRATVKLPDASKKYKFKLIDSSRNVYTSSAAQKF